MFSRNRVMLASGWAPAADVARVLGKNLSTVHRMVADERIEGARDGRSLYVSVSSLETYFTNQKNKSMVEAIQRLSAKLKEEAEDVDKEKPNVDQRRKHLLSNR